MGGRNDVTDGAMNRGREGRREGERVGGNEEDRREGRGKGGGNEKRDD